MAQEGEKRIINKIVQMADEEAGKIMADAQSNADEIRKAAELKANSEAQDIIKHGTQEAKRDSKEFWQMHASKPKER